jgi:hypothetical protein
LAKNKLETVENIEWPDGLKRKDRKAFLQDCMEFVKDRTAQGYDETTTKFEPYTKEYAKKKGVSRNKVDLKLSSDMLDSMEAWGFTSDYGKIGYKRKNTEQGKAEGNILGSYGREPDPEKARPFLGLSKEEINAIAGAYID